MQADYIFYNGNIYTMDDTYPKASSIAVKNGKIISIDEDFTKVEGKDTQLVNLNEEFVMPGLIESHAHPVHYAANLYKLDLRAEVTPDIESILHAVEKRANEVPEGEWIIGIGWDDSKLKEKRFPTIDELSKVAPNHPVFLKRTCVHNAVVNRKALYTSGLTEQPIDPEGGHFHIDSNGKLSGLIQENAMMEFSVPSFSIKELMEAMFEAQKNFFEWGITTVHDMAVTKEEMTVFQQLQKEKDFKLKARLWLWARDQMGWVGVQESVQALGISSLFGDDYLNIQGLKYMLDGSVGGCTAAVEKPYENQETNTGILYMGQEKIDDYVQQAMKNNMRVSIHGIGERAIEMAIQALTKNNYSEENKKKRHRIEHCALPKEKDLKQMSKHGIIAGSSIGFIYSIGDSYAANLGHERVNRVFPQASFKANGIPAPGNSDLPVCNGNPFYGIYSSVVRKTMNGKKFGTEESISIEDALKNYTIDAAYSGFDERILGSLEKDKYADMVILDKNPFQIEEEELKDIKVNKTIVEGEIVYQRL